MEFDGKAKYTKLRKVGQSIEEVVMAEKAREDLIRGLGYTVIRFDWNELANPPAVIARFARTSSAAAGSSWQADLPDGWTAKPALHIPRPDGVARPA